MASARMHTNIYHVQVKISLDGQLIIITGYLWEGSPHHCMRVCVLQGIAVVGSLPVVLFTKIKLRVTMKAQKHIMYKNRYTLLTTGILLYKFVYSTYIPGFSVDDLASIVSTSSAM